jgi:gamma-tubulin complex component 2
LALLDQVLEIHDNFLDTCLKECMLTNPKSLKTISKLLSVWSVLDVLTFRFLCVTMAEANSLAIPIAN